MNVPTTKTVSVGSVHIGGGHPLALIAGPCVIENEEVALETGERVQEIAQRVGMSFIFKSSYLKDNRSSAETYQGPGLKMGLKILEKVRESIHVPILSDVHCAAEAKEASDVLDVVQIPAYLCMQTQLTLEVGKWAKAVNVKKGQFLDPHDVRHIVGKLENVGNTNILLTERGSCFGYHNLVVDIRSLPIMRRFGYPVIFDVTHAIRVYGRSSSDPSGGQPEFVPYLARAAVASGCDAIFIETHPCVKEALCDAASMWPLAKLEGLLIQLKAIDDLVKSN